MSRSVGSMTVYFLFAVAALALTGCGDDGNDSASADAAAETDAAAQFGCQQTSCTSATEYCYMVNAGVAPVEGCNPLPPDCQTTRSCSCVLASIDDSACGTSLGCTADGDQITVACNLP